MTVDAQLTEIVRQGMAKREAATDREWLRGVTRVEIEPVEHLTYRAHPAADPDFQLTIDEPRDRGGQHQGPSPLDYFLTGAGACLLNQFVRLAIARGLGLSFRHARVRGEFGREVGGRFQHITQEIDAEGSASDEEVGRLCADAEARCYVHQTLSSVVAMTTILNLNGREIARRTSRPA